MPPFQVNARRHKSHAVIFDMDGILIDSEPFWQTAEKEAFAKVGIDLTPEDMALTLGLSIEEAAAFWYRRHPWKGSSPDQVAQSITLRMIEIIRHHGRLMPGVEETLKSLRAYGISLAVASSSSRRLIDTVVDRFDLGDFFAALASAEDEVYGKPHPAVFLKASSTLGVEPPACLVIEDSLNGVIAAKAARMTCLAIPDPRQRNDPRFAIADEVLDSLEALDEQAWARWIEPAGMTDAL